MPADWEIEDLLCGLVHMLAVFGIGPLIRTVTLTMEPETQTFITICCTKIESCLGISFTMDIPEQREKLTST